jgi:DNA-binding PucR family transcriptional regulator
VHPNTLDYRLRRVTELTGLDLGRTDDLALTVLALKQRALSAERAVSDLEIVTSASP